MDACTSAGVGSYMPMRVVRVNLQASVCVRCAGKRNPMRTQRNATELSAHLHALAYSRVQQA
eukprot:6190633-Pleurochrysis_carterae.AAC.1